VDANCRTGPVVSDWSENDCTLRLVVSDLSGGVGVVCGMKRGISEVDLSLVQVQIGEPTHNPTGESNRGKPRVDLSPRTALCP